MVISSQLLHTMQQYVNRSENIAAIEQAWTECEADLRTQAGLEMAYRAVVPRLELAHADATFSLWVFAFASHGESDKHRHSNSTQITCTWRGQGRLQIGDMENLQEIVLPLQLPERDPKQNWTVIPPKVFHHAQAEANGWAVVSFQTVPAEELQNEPYLGEAQHYLH